jgi:DNA-binding MarR family transcriptional regulator
MAEPAVDRIRDLPPSAKLVYYILDKRGEMTQKALIEESMLPERTVRAALGDLDEAGLLQTDINFADARQRLYQVQSFENS